MKLPIVIGILSIFCFSTHAQTKTKKNLYKSEKNEEAFQNISINKPSDRSVEFSLGYLSNEMMSSDLSEDSKINGQGVGVRIGKSFNLSADINTNTSLVGSALAFKNEKEDIADGSIIKTNSIELGLAQRLSYDINSTGTIFRPFIEAGVSRGKYTQKISDGADYFNGEVNYNKYGGTVGMQIVFDNNIVPFIMYDYSKVKFDNKIRIEDRVDGVSFSGDVPLETSNGNKANSNTLTLGIGFLF